MREYVALYESFEQLKHEEPNLNEAEILKKVGAWIGRNVGGRFEKKLEETVAPKGIYNIIDKKTKRFNEALSKKLEDPATTVDIAFDEIYKVVLGGKAPEKSINNYVMKQFGTLKKSFEEIGKSKMEGINDETKKTMLQKAHDANAKLKATEAALLKAEKEKMLKTLKQDINKTKFTSEFDYRVALVDSVGAQIEEKLATKYFGQSIAAEYVDDYKKSLQNSIETGQKYQNATKLAEAGAEATTTPENLKTKMMTDYGDYMNKKEPITIKLPTSKQMESYLIKQWADKTVILTKYDTVKKKAGTDVAVTYDDFKKSLDLKINAALSKPRRPGNPQTKNAADVVKPEETK